MVLLLALVWLWLRLRRAMDVHVCRMWRVSPMRWSTTIGRRWAPLV
jgi:hypothetical protein